MASLTVQLTNICSGGNHLTFNVTGAAQRIQTLDLTSLAEPLAEEDVAAFLRVLTRLAKSGRTNAQTRALLQAGVTVNV